MIRSIALVVCVACPMVAFAQPVHEHAMPVNAVGGGVPYFCASPTATAVADGPWSSPATWSNRAVPAAGAKVLIPAGREVTYDVASGDIVQCVELRGRMAFATDRNTRLNVVTVVVMEDGVFEVGTEQQPIAAGVRAEIQIADRPFDVTLDPGQVGNGIVGLGRIRMHGAIKTPTFARLAADARGGQTRLQLERPVQGWAVGDRLVVPDTRQLREAERGRSFKSRDEEVEISAIDGATITVRPALAWDHPGAVESSGRTLLQPHVGNLSRNVIVGSERGSGTRGHMMFLARADVDLRYVEVREMGRTANSTIDSTSFDGEGRVLRVGANQIGRYAIHFHHNFGPAANLGRAESRAPANGFQFTLIGNSVVAPSKWGITIHNTHYGLVRDNVVYNSRGAAIVTEDGNESFNVFDHNFAVRSIGSGDATPRGGYGGGGPDPGTEGSAFWFSGPNNYVRNNVAANADAFGFSLAGPATEMRVPAAPGADMRRDAETRPLDPSASPVLEFSNNEAYGAMQIGVDCNWNGLISKVTVWNVARNGIVGLPSTQLVIDGLMARGDAAILADPQENPTGVWLGNYIGREIVVRHADVEGLRTGIASPFVSGPLGGGRAVNPGSVVIERSRFRSYYGVVVGTAYASGAAGQRTAVVRSSLFETLPGAPVNAASPPAAISMNYRMAPGDAAPREPILVQDFNNKPGETFKVYYSLDAPPETAPCHESRPDIGGWVCR